jgi:hypothetical protein
MNVEGVVCICSRGLVFSKTIEAVDYNMANAPGKWERVFTHNEPIPDAQNKIVERARHYKPRWLWFVEEDIIPMHGVLATLLKYDNNYDVISAKYKLRGGTWAHKMINQTELIYTGLGCLLVKLSVFDKIGFPYFRTDRQFDHELRTVSNMEQPYGGQDMFFFSRLREHHIPIKLVDVVCQHLYVKRFGDLTNNVGFHNVGYV